MTRPPDSLHPQEYQTLEYVLEYGGEGGSAAILRTTLRGRPRYWQLKRHFAVHDGLPIEVGSELVFLAHEAVEALRGAAHPWWTLTGLLVAADLISDVQSILAEQGLNLDMWLLPSRAPDPHALRCELIWPACDIPRRPVDAYWLTARPETMRRLLGGLTEAQVEGLHRDPAQDVGLLVDRKGRVLQTAAFDYPFDNQWNGHGPFVPHPAFTVHTLSDVWNKV